VKTHSRAEENVEPAGTTQRSHTRRLIIFVAVIIINAGLLAALGLALLTPASNQPDTHFDSVTQPGNINSPLIGKPAPDFTLQALNENNATAVHLTNFKGKTVVLNFWQSSCDPCNTEAPFMQKTWAQVQSKGVVFIGVDVQDTSNSAHAFLHKYGITYLNVAANLNNATINNYGITGFPETYFIDKTGIVASEWIGPLNTEGMQSELTKLAIK
jgi:cytochrome c biogenesis protein CcmG/thiol:disulfide interchange protein DsbE